MDDELACVVDAFLGKYPNLAKPRGATSQCSSKTQNLITDLKAAGRGAGEVWFKGHRHDVPCPHPGGDTSEEHAAVLVDDQTVVDVSRRQYDPDAELPTVYVSVDASGRDWLEVYVDDARSKTSPLPAQQP